MTPRRVGVFGGTFDPIHIGHLAAAQDVAGQFALDRILFVPNNIPPHKHDRQSASATDRVRMVELAVEDNPLFELSTVELEREGPSYTLDTMRILRRKLGGRTQLWFLTGSDSLATLATWHEPQALLAEFNLVMIEREGEARLDWDALEIEFPEIRDRVRAIAVPRLDISSEDIRRRLSERRSVRYYVPDAVIEYIAGSGLYSDSP